MGYYNESELKALGFRSIGKNVLISKRASIYGAGNIQLGDQVRVDDFALLSAKGIIQIGRYVHIAAYSAIYGGSSVTIGDFSGLSPRCTLFSESDDFSGESMIHPFFDAKFKPLYKSEPVSLGRFVQLGSGTTVMPGCRIADGSVTGAHSLVLESLDEWGIYAGIPVKRLKDRSRKVERLALRAVEANQR